MKTIRLLLTLLIAAGLTSSRAQYTWMQKSDFRGSARENAVPFSIAREEYAGAGSAFSHNYYKDFWEYTPEECLGLTVYADADNDSYGDVANSLYVEDCVVPSGYVLDSTDCNDNNASIHPGACDDGNGIDENCDGSIDNGYGTKTYWADADGDLYGDIETYVDVCSLPQGYVSDHSDCNDNNASINPGAIEISNGLDDNCNGTIDEGFAPDTWLLKTDVGLTGPVGAIGFSIGSKGYIGTGYSFLNDNHKDFWEYDPVLNTWSQKADFGGTGRYDAVGFSIGTKGYVGTGVSRIYSNYEYKKDFWEYDPDLNLWTQKADFSGTVRAGAVGFSIGSKGYIGTGYSSTGVFKDFWEYNPATDKWRKKANFPGTARSGAGFSIGNNGYIGMGSSNLWVGPFYNDFWQYDPEVNTWTQKKNFPGMGRAAAVGFSIGDKGYFGTGYPGWEWYGWYYCIGDFWMYDPYLDIWTEQEWFGGIERKSAVGFSIGSKGYIGLGENYEYRFTDFWEYTPGGCNGFTLYADVDNDGYGDAGNSYFAGDCIVPDGYVASSTDCNDTNAAIHPDAEEIINGMDDDCNGIIDDLPCGIPTGMLTTNITESSVELKWNPVDSAISYKLRFKINNNGTWIDTSSFETYLNIDGLLANTRYTWKVKSKCDGKPKTTSDWSAKQYFTTAAFKIGDEQKASLELYPSPVSDNFTLDLQLASTTNQSATIYLLNSLGQIIFSSNEITGNGTLRKEISMPASATSGWYIVRVVMSDQVMEKKLLYQK